MSGHKFKVGDRVEMLDEGSPFFGTFGVVRVVEHRSGELYGYHVEFEKEGYTGVYAQKQLRLAGDVVEHPAHYTAHPSGVECIQVTEHMGFNLGNAVKYIWRCDLKQDAVEDLKKARWYIDREIAKRVSA